MRAQTTALTIALLTLAAGAVLGDDLGPDDRQISFTGPSGSTASDAVTPAVAFDDVNQRYLTVWSSDEVDGDFFVVGRFLSGASGEPIGPEFKISAAGVAGSDHRQPAAAFDADRERFLVVWSGDGLQAGAYEIMGQAVAADGALVGPNRRYSDMGANDVDAQFDAVTPDVVWHPGLDAFVVVWAGDDDTGSLGDGRFEIYGQMIDAEGLVEIGANDFRISYAGPDTQGNDATNPAIAVTDEPQRWYVAFEGDVVDDGIHAPEIFIYGGTADVPDGAATAMPAMGASYFDTDFTARNPDLAWAPSSGELVCVWDGENGGGLPRQIYGQRMDPSGVLSGVLMSLSASLPPVVAPLREAIEPALAVDPITDLWFVAWRGDLDDGLVKFDHEIWGGRFDDVGAPQGVFADQLSAMDPVLDPIAGAGAPAVAVNATHGFKMIVWSGDRDVTLGGEHEIFAQAWSDDGITDVAPPAAALRLHDAAPNPFNPSTRIAFEMPADGIARLRVYDAAGRLVRTLADGRFPAGSHALTWDGRDDAGRASAAGVYLYRLETADRATSKRMTLVK